MKHILIPTDFSIKSLNVVNSIVAKYGDEPIRITFLHMVSMPTSITELLLLRRSKSRYEDNVHPEFYDACHVLQNRYSDIIAMMDVKIVFGDTRKYLQNYLEANGITKVVVANDVPWQNYFKESVNMLLLLAKVKTDIEYMSSISKENNFADMSVISMNNIKNVKQIKEELHYVTEE